MLLSGRVCLIPVRKVSPSGIPHCQFVLEHRSQHREAGFHRLAWCRMTTVVSGHTPQELTKKLKVGSKVIVQGFITCHKQCNGLTKLVLHAEQIELIDSGD